MNRSRLPLLAVTVVAPLIVSALVVVASVLLIPDLGRSIAIHWGVSGAADGSAPAWTVLVGFAALAIVTPLIAGVALAGVGPQGLTGRLKIIAVLPLWLAGVLGVVQLWVFGAQRDPAADPDLPVLMLVVALAVGFVLAALGWLVAPPRAPHTASTVASVEPLPVGDRERVVWLGTAAMSTRVRLVLVATTLLSFGSVTLAVVVSQGAAWPLYIVPVVIAVLIAATTAFTVRVDARGLTVRSVIGVPVFRVPTGEVRGVHVVDVNPMADFGGWGLRLGSGRRFGVVTRAGAAIEVERDGGRYFVVTVEDAATAAALLAAVSVPAG